MSVWFSNDGKYIFAKDYDSARCSWPTDLLSAAKARAPRDVLLVDREFIWPKFETPVEGNQLAVATKQTPRTSRPDSAASEGSESSKSTQKQPDSRYRTPTAANNMNGEAIGLSRQGRHQEAEAKMRECLALREQILKADDWIIGYSHSVLGGILIDTGKLQEAERSLLQAYESLKNRSPFPGRVHECAERLVRLYATWGNKVEQERWQQIAAEQVGPKPATSEAEKPKVALHPPDAETARRLGGRFQDARGRVLRISGEEGLLEARIHWYASGPVTHATIGCSGASSLIFDDGHKQYEMQLVKSSDGTVEQITFLNITFVRAAEPERASPSEGHNGADDAANAEPPAGKPRSKRSTDGRSGATTRPTADSSKLTKKELAKSESGTVTSGTVGRKIAQIVKDETVKGFSGAVLVAVDGKVVTAVGAGFADLENEKPNTPDTLFEIASTTKQFTAAAVMRLVQDGKLKLDDPISKHLPGIPDDCKAITVEHLLRHTSGIPGENSQGGGTDIAKVLPSFLKGGPAHEPGTHWEYWNQGYAIVTEIIHSASDKEYVDYCREALFAPAGLTATCFTGDDAPKDTLVAMGRSSRGPSRSALDHPYGSYGFQYRGMGGIVTSVWDLWRWDRALRGDKVLNAESKKALFKRGPGNYALGWFLRRDEGGRLMHTHGGGVRGFCCDLRRYPDDDALIVVLCNKDDYRVPTLSEAIGKAMFETP